ncbi:hypothetical protein AaE_004936 [Aphanomyces astaci]|uniref:Reverse transcriptase domain-containing protein n=1 Tax=Aphanomyces astaci TaxID=112090 RepID=A0A6A5AQ37_APHAT|nr:hypothetical protein AaE_004936 [Aphanomyces astaci]
MLIWIDDIFVYADTVEGYVDALESFFDRVAQYGFKLSPSKTKLFTDQVKRCGRIISGDGVKQDPKRIEHLCAIPYPTNAGEDSMAEYAQTVDPLHQCLTKALEGGEKQALDAVKSKLRSSVELSHPRDDATMCLFTDASDYGWSIVVTQVVAFDDDSPIQEQRQDLLLCQSEMFAGAQKAC